MRRRYLKYTSYAILMFAWVLLFIFPIFTAKKLVSVLPPYARMVANHTLADGVDHYRAAMDMDPGQARDLLYQRAAGRFTDAVAIFADMADANPHDAELVAALVRANQLRYATHKVRLGYHKQPDFFFTSCSVMIWY